MPPYDGYPPQGYGGYPTYGQAQMSQASPNQNPRPFPMQQQQHPSVVIPSSHDQQTSQRNQAWHQPQVNYQQPPPQQFQAYYPTQQQPQQYQQPSPLQQFVSGDFQAQELQGYQRGWVQQGQGVNYQVPLHASQRPSQPQRQHIPPQRQQVPPQQAPRQTPGPATSGLYQPQAPRQPQTPQQRPQQLPPSQPSQPRPSQNQPARSHQSAQPFQGQQPRSQQRSQPSQSQQYQAYQQPGHSTKPSQKPPKQSQQTPRPAPQPSPAQAPAPQQHTTAYVHIPVQRVNEMAQGLATPQQRSPKRRRSNEGIAIHVTPAPGPAIISSANIRPPESSPLTELPSSQIPSTPAPEADYQAVLLALSDEYVTAAHTMSTHLCSGKATEEQWDQYHEMIATGMGCLESVLANYRQPDPRKEARIRLKLAMLMFEETENTEELDQVLSKGIEHCDRFRLVNTKHALKHLSLRAQFRTSTKAAFKAAEKAIADTQAQGLHRWVHAFRLLRISMSMQAGGPAETTATLRHLTALAEEADAQQQIPVQVAAATLETMVHLRSGSVDAVEQAQRSLTAARTHQLAPEMKQLSQLRAAIDCMDLACSLAQYTPAQSKAKMDHLHSNLDTTTKSVGWVRDGTFLLPLGIAAEDDIEADTGAIFRKSSSGELALSVKWLSRSQLYMIGFVLSALALMNQNIEKRKAETFITEGLKMNRPVTDMPHMSVAACEAMNEMQESTSLTLKLLLIFAYCGRSDWSAASDAISTLRHDLANTELGRDELTSSTLLYLGGVCKQGLGELENALELYQSPALAYPPPTKTTPFLTDLRILATLNRIQILRPTNPTLATSLLQTLQEPCKNHPNRSLHSASHTSLAHSLSHSHQSIIKIKQFLQSALAPAQSAKNTQLLSIIMSTMTELFFKDIVGKQAMASATAGKQLAAKTQDPLWGVVADGLMRETLEREGRTEEAVVVDGQIGVGVGKVAEEVGRRLGLTG